MKNAIVNQMAVKINTILTIDVGRRLQMNAIFEYRALSFKYYEIYSNIMRN